MRGQTLCSRLRLNLAGQAFRPDKGASMFFKKLSSIWLATSLAIAGALFVSQAAVSAATMVVVSHDGQHGWLSRITDFNGNPDPTYGSVTFVTGPNPMPPGNGLGSLRLMTNPNMRPTDPIECPTAPCSHGDGSAQIRNSNYAGVLLSSLTQLGYWTYHNSVPSSPNQQQWPYLSLDVSCAGCMGGATPTNSDRLFFEPPYQALGTGGPTCTHQAATITNTWQQWDALNGCWWDNNGELGTLPGATGGTDGTGSLSAFIAKHSDARIYNPNGLGGLRLLVGFASPADQFDGNVDMVRVGVGGQNSPSDITYNFEPPTCREADGNGDFHSQDGRQGNVQMDNDKCEESGVGGNGESDQGDSVDSTNRGDGRDFHSTNVEATQFDAVAGTTTITGIGTTSGTPVAFTIIALGSSLTSLGSVTMIFSDGFSITGDLTDGSITLN